MDLAITLVKSVMRAFYPTREILVMDALILHETQVFGPNSLEQTPNGVTSLRDDDLAYLMAMNTKDLHKVCGRLREDRLLTVHTRAELRDGNPRPSNRTWYYINYRHTIDAIKWRVYAINKEVQGTTAPVSEKKEYFCSRCGSGWTQYEVLDKFGEDGFECHKCGAPLSFEADRNAGGHEQSTRLNNQTKFISELLPRIDDVHIPECNFDRALAKARPVLRDAAHQRAATTAIDSETNRPMAVKGLTNLGPQSIAVNISTSDGPTEAEKEAEKARKEQVAKQNALPSWMSNSTVTGESFSAVASGGIATAIKETIDDSKQMSSGQIDSKASAQIDDIFEKLKAEQAAERAREIAEEEESGSEEEDDDEEEEFEDVRAETTAAGTSRHDSEALSREDSSDERQTKRVKVDSGLKVEDLNDEEDDDDVEFEDV